MTVIIKQVIFYSGESVLGVMIHKTINAKKKSGKIRLKISNDIVKNKQCSCLEVI